MTQLPIQLDTRTEDAGLSYGADQLSDDAILQRAEAILAARCVRDGDVVSSPADARALIRMRTATLAHEVFGVVYLSTRHRVLGFEELFRGGHRRVMGRVTVLRGGGIGVDRRARDDRGTQPGVGCEHTMEADQMEPWAGD